MKPFMPRAARNLSDLRPEIRDHALEALLIKPKTEPELGQAQPDPFGLARVRASLDVTRAPARN
jgi:hypothetical protein